MVNDIEDWTPPRPAIPSHWVGADFDEVFEIITTSNKKIKQKEYLEAGLLPVIDQGAILIGGYTDDLTNKITVTQPVIVFGDHTRCFKLINFDFAPGADGTKVLAIRSDIDPTYLYYLCRILQLPNRGYSRHFSFLRKSVLPIAPINEQKRIVDKIERLFSNLDEGELLLKQVQQQLVTYRQSVLKAAITGELTKDWREKNKHRLESGEALLKRILKARRENWNGRGRYKEPPSPDASALPELPEGWGWASGEQLFIWSSGKFLPAKIMASGTIPVYGGNGINGYHNESLINNATIVIGRVGAHCGNVHISKSKSWITDNAIYAVSLPIGCNLTFLAGVFKTAKLGHTSKGGAQPFVNQDSLKECPVPLPPTEEQNELVDRLNDSFSQIDALETWCASQLERSSTLRQSILKDAFSGKLVPQDPRDEPAGELLKRIQAERAKQAKAPKQKVPDTARRRRPSPKIR